MRSVITIAILLAAALMSCSFGHSSDRVPDTVIRVNGCLYMGFRTRHYGDLVHAGHCDNPIHLRMHPDTVYINSTTTDK